MNGLALVHRLRYYSTNNAAANPIAGMTLGCPVGTAKPDDELVPAAVPLPDADAAVPVAVPVVDAAAPVPVPVVSAPVAVGEPIVAERSEPVAFTSVPSVVGSVAPLGGRMVSLTPGNVCSGGWAVGALSCARTLAMAMAKVARSVVFIFAVLTSVINARACKMP